MSFDLKAAREICSRIKGYEDPDGGNFADFQAAEMLPAALDEIERLQADNQKWREYNLQLDRKNRKLLAALKKLGKEKRERGKALVEERISGEFSDWIENQCPHWDIDEEPFCVELDGPCEYHEGKCPISMELHRIAREQLRREGLL